MNTLILHPAYFGSIEQFVYFAKAEKICFENEDNYQKQSYRSRQYIYGANGKLLLNIPIKHSKDKRQKYKEIKIENEKDIDLQAGQGFLTPNLIFLLSGCFCNQNKFLLVPIRISD